MSDHPTGDGIPTVARLLEVHKREIEALVRAEAGSRLAFEEVEDLVQGAHTRALEFSNKFTYRNPEAALAWLRLIVRTHLAHRREHWSALRRRPGGLLRLVVSDEETRWALLIPADTATGPGTFAGRREAITTGVRALDLLLPRDRDLVLWTVEGYSMADIATKLNMNAESAGRVQRRALDRLRRTFRLLVENRPR